MSHGLTDAVIIGVVLFLAGACFMFILHMLVVMTKYFMDKLEKK